MFKLEKWGIGCSKPGLKSSNKEYSLKPIFLLIPVTQNSNFGYLIRSLIITEIFILIVWPGPRRTKNFVLGNEILLFYIMCGLSFFLLKIFFFRENIILELEDMQTATPVSNVSTASVVCNFIQLFVLDTIFPKKLCFFMILLKILYTIFPLYRYIRSLCLIKCYSQTP